MMEIRLDRLEKSPEVKELIDGCKKPAIISCRRTQDGGEWNGPEASRLALLRQAVLDKAAYVEIELDIADQIRRYGETKRVIAYTNTAEVPDNLVEIYQQACSKDPDVVKITVPARNPQEAWPVIKMLAKGAKPTVAVGWGKSGIMLSVLGQRYKAPWIYAALERGMEAYPGMATVVEMEHIYDFRSIDSKTPLLALSGFSEEQLISARILNHGFRIAENRTRCLPLEIGEVGLFADVVKAVKLAGIVVDDPFREKILDVATELDDAAKLARAADFVAIKGEDWKAFNTLNRAVVGAIEDAVKAKNPGIQNAIEGKTFVVVGCSGTARTIAAGLEKKGAIIVLADKDNDRAQRVASSMNARFVPSGQVYSTMCDGMILCRSDRNPQIGKAAIEIPKSCAKEGMIGVDLTAYPKSTPFLEEVRLLGGIPVPPKGIFLRTMLTILKAYTGQSYTPEQFQEIMEDIDFERTQ